MRAEDAYKDWNKDVKVDMRVHTNEQMFIYGFNTAKDFYQKIVNEMLDIINELEKKNGKRSGKSS